MSRITRSTCKVLVNTDPVAPEIFAQALGPELQTDYGQRATTRLSIDSPHLAIEVDSPDITALRATLNSLLRWVEMIEELLTKGG